MRQRNKQALQSIEWPADALVAAAENLEKYTASQTCLQIS